jgi:hypothetical protein
VTLGQHHHLVSLPRSFRHGGTANTTHDVHVLVNRTVVRCPPFLEVPRGRLS